MIEAAGRRVMAWEKWVEKDMAVPHGFADGVASRMRLRKGAALGRPGRSLDWSGVAGILCNHPRALGDKLPPALVTSRKVLRSVLSARYFPVV